MKAITVAAAGAAVVGSVNASSHLKHMHAKLHANVARDEPWLDWQSSTTTTPKVPSVQTTTAADPNWSDWESTTTTTTKPVVATTTGDHTWSDWVEPTTTVTLKSTVTTTKYVQPVTGTLTWGDWAETTGAPAIPAVVTSRVGWSSAGWFGPSWSVDAGQCAVSVITSYGLPTWFPVPAAASSSSESHTWADWTSSVPVVPATTTTTTTTPKAPETWADWSSTTTSSVPVVPVTTASSTWADWTSTTTQAPATSTTASTGKPGGGYPGIKPNGNHWGLTYSPYTAQGGCKDAATVAKDLAIIAKKGFSTVRVYSTDCNTLENIGKSARDNGLKLIIGVWINASGFSAAQAQVDAIAKWAQWDIVELIVVGNEVVFNGIASGADLAGFISKSKWAFSAAGYTGPVTTTEPLSVWEDTKNSGPLGAVIDVVGANLYAFFNAQISADKAGGFIQAQIDILNKIFAGKSIYVLESGWPHSGNANGAAVPSPENQKIALKGIQAAVGAQVVFLSYEDEPWKEPGQFGVEPFWGCANIF